MAVTGVAATRAALQALYAQRGFAGQSEQEIANLLASFYQSGDAVAAAALTGTTLTLTGTFRRSVAVPAAAGNSQGTGTALTAELNAVTGADGTKGVVLPTAVAGMRITVVNTDTSSVLKVYPATGGAINSIAANSAFSLVPGESADFVASSTTQWYTGVEGSTFNVAGVATGYKVARGENQQATASDTVVTGLTTVVAVAIAPRTVTVKQLFFGASIGDQAGTPAAGSILITSKKPTAVNDVTPIAATDFTDNIKVNWIAIGT